MPPIVDLDQHGGLAVNAAGWAVVDPFFDNDVFLTTKGNSTNLAYMEGCPLEIHQRVTSRYQWPCLFSSLKQHQAPKGAPKIDGYVAPGTRPPLVPIEEYLLVGYAMPYNELDDEGERLLDVTISNELDYCYLDAPASNIPLLIGTAEPTNVLPWRPDNWLFIVRKVNLTDTSLYRMVMSDLGFLVDVGSPLEDNLIIFFRAEFREPRPVMNQRMVRWHEKVNEAALYLAETQNFRMGLQMQQHQQMPYGTNISRGMNAYNEHQIPQSNTIVQPSQHHHQTNIITSTAPASHNIHQMAQSNCNPIPQPGQQPQQTNMIPSTAMNWVNINQIPQTNYHAIVQPSQQHQQANTDVSAAMSWVNINQIPQANFNTIIQPAQQHMLPSIAMHSYDPHLIPQANYKTSVQTSQQHQQTNMIPATPMNSLNMHQNIQEGQQANAIPFNQSVLQPTGNPFVRPRPQAVPGSQSTTGFMHSNMRRPPQPATQNNTFVPTQQNLLTHQPPKHEDWKEEFLKVFQDRTSAEMAAASKFETGYDGDKEHAPQESSVNSVPYSWTANYLKWDKSSGCSSDVVISDGSSSIHKQQKYVPADEGIQRGVRRPRSETSFMDDALRMGKLQSGPGVEDERVTKRRRMGDSLGRGQPLHDREQEKLAAKKRRVGYGFKEEHLPAKQQEEPVVKKRKMGDGLSAEQSQLGQEVKEEDERTVKRSRMR